MSKRAGAVSAETKECILRAARQEFAARGFQGSSLRRICAGAGVTTGALYFFFKGKDDLFETVLSGVTRPFHAFMKAHYASEQGFAEKTLGEGEQEDLEVTALLIDLYFQNRQTWDIILAHQSHPAVRRFLEEFIQYSTDHYMGILTRAEQMHPRRTRVDRFDLQQFMQMQTDSILNLISQDFTREEMVAHSKTVVKMLRGAFFALMQD